MCGIAGNFSGTPDVEWINSTVESLTPRGPDHQESKFIDTNLVMGASRLAMTDPLPRSNQPFVREDLDIAITFNGEIYNYKEIRSELKQSGYSFRTDSDTEVLLLALHKYGKNVTSKINGMYAFAFYSKRDQSLLLGRDSLGKKPLYFYFDSIQFSWSSSLRTLSRKYGEKISDIALNQYLSFGYTIDQDTIYEEIQAIKPGEMIEVSKSGLGFNLAKFLSSPFQIRPVDEKLSIRETLISAVESRIEGHENVAISLSGGLDSSIVAFVAKELGAKVTAYSAIWPNSDKARYNEDATRAKLFAKKIGISFQEVEMFSPSDLEANLIEFVTALEEPNANPTGVSMMKLYKTISEDNFRLVLTGDGADEIFGGYPRYRSQSKLPNLLNLQSDYVSSLMSKHRVGLGGKLANILASQISIHNHHKWSHWHWNMTPNLTSELRQNSLSPHEIDRQMKTSIARYQKTPNKSDVDSLMKLDKDLWISMESNRKLDRISMKYSIEARSPFQDERVVSLGERLPPISNSKEFEKESLWRAFPEMEKYGVRTDKTGFISPLGHWLRGNEKLIGRLSSQAASKFELDRELVTKLLNSPKSGNYRDFMNLWSLVVLAAWEDTL